MLKTYADKRTANLARGLAAPEFRSFEAQARKRLRVLNNAERLEDLMALKSNHLEALSGNRKGQYSIRINLKWRICFTFEEGDAYDIEIVDYHR